MNAKKFFLGVWFLVGACCIGFGIEDTPAPPSCHILIADHQQLASLVETQFGHLRSVMHRRTVIGDLSHAGGLSIRIRGMRDGIAGESSDEELAQVFAPQTSNKAKHRSVGFLTVEKHKRAYLLVHAVGSLTTSRATLVLGHQFRITNLSTWQYCEVTTSEFGAAQLPRLETGQEYEVRYVGSEEI